MSTRNGISFDHPAAADLSTKEYAFVKLAAGGVVACSTLGERADGVLGNAPTSGQAASIQDGPVILVKVGAVAVADAAELTPNANGLAITAVATNIVHAKALQAGAAGATIRALAVASYAKP